MHWLPVFSGTVVGVRDKLPEGCVFQSHLATKSFKLWLAIYLPDVSVHIYTIQTIRTKVTLNT